MKRIILSIFMMFYAFAPALAIENYLAPAQEERAKALFREIRCLVCEGESIADSNADLAKDLRDIIRTQITEGKADQDIIDMMVQNYGQQVLMNPPLNISTLPLWIAPLALIAIGVIILIISFKRKPNTKK